MKKFVCDTCGYVYDPQQGDPDNGIAPGTSFEDLPEDWVCPLCGVGKDDFSEEQNQSPTLRETFFVYNPVKNLLIIYFITILI